MAGPKHVTAKQLSSGAAVAVRPLPCRSDVAGSEIPRDQGRGVLRNKPILQSRFVQSPNRSHVRALHATRRCRRELALSRRRELTVRAT